MTARRALLTLAGGLSVGEAVGLAAQFGHHLTGFVIVVLLQGALWAVAAAIVSSRAIRPALALVLVAAGLMRLIALAAPVFLSSDINRYVWDGRVQVAGINPYRYIPTDPALSSLRDAEVFPNINRNNYAPTIYPPVAQILFLLANLLGGTVPVVKLVMVALEAVGVWALLGILRARGAPPEQILLYAWHPLPIWEIAGSGHLEGAVVGFVTLALGAALRGRQAWSGAALAAAGLVKFFPLAVAPALWRPRPSNLGDWRWPAAFMALVAMTYVPYIGVGWRVLGFLPGYIAEENLSSGSGFWLLAVARNAVPLPLAGYLLVAYFALAGAVMTGLAIGALLRPPHPHSDLPWATALGCATLIFLSPHYPWYFVVLVALLTAAPWWPAWWLSLTAVLLYWDGNTGRTPIWVGFTIYGGFAILGAVDLGRRVFSARRAGANNASKRTT